MSNLGHNPHYCTALIAIKKCFFSYSPFRPYKMIEITNDSFLMKMHTSEHSRVPYEK